MEVFYPQYSHCLMMFSWFKYHCNNRHERQPVFPPFSSIPWASAPSINHELYHKKSYLTNKKNMKSTTMYNTLMEILTHLFHDRMAFVDVLKSCPLNAWQIRPLVSIIKCFYGDFCCWYWVLRLSFYCVTHWCRMGWNSTTSYGTMLSASWLVDGCRSSVWMRRACSYLFTHYD